MSHRRIRRCAVLSSWRCRKTTYEKEIKFWWTVSFIKIGLSVVLIGVVRWRGTVFRRYNLSKFFKGRRVGAGITKSVEWLDYVLDDLEFGSQQSQEMSFWKRSAWPTIRSVLVVKRLGREADQSRASSAEIKMEWSYASAPSPSVFMAYVATALFVRDIIRLAGSKWMKWPVGVPLLGRWEVREKL